MYTPNLSAQEQAYVNSKPTTYDFLKPNGFLFTVQELPHVSYTCQGVNLPDVSFGAAMQSTPYLDVFHAGEKVTFSDLAIRFIVSEDMANYKELFNWIVGMGDPTGTEKYKEFIQNRTKIIDNPKSDAVKYSDATLTILTSANNSSININFKRIFPIGLTSLQFDTTVTDIQYFTCNAVFKYERYEFQVP